MKLLIVAIAVACFSGTVWAECTPWQPDNSGTCPLPKGDSGIRWNRDCKNTPDDLLAVCTKPALHQSPTANNPKCGEITMCLDRSAISPNPLGCEQWVNDTTISASQGCHGQSLSYWTRQNSCSTIGRDVPTHFCSASIPSDDSNALPSATDYTQQNFDPDNFDRVRELFGN